MGKYIVTFNGSLITILPVCSGGGVGIVVRLDLEVVKDYGHLLIGLGQKEI